MATPPELEGSASLAKLVLPPALGAELGVHSMRGDDVHLVVAVGRHDKVGVGRLDGCDERRPAIEHGGLPSGFEDAPGLCAFADRTDVAPASPPGPTDVGAEADDSRSGDDRVARRPTNDSQVGGVHLDAGARAIEREDVDCVEFPAVR